MSALALCSASGVMYNKFEFLTNHQFTIQQEKRLTDENDPSIAKDHSLHQPRFRFWIAKGAAQFIRLFSKHPEFDPKITFQSFLIDQFYLEIFPSEKDELYKLVTDEDMWHLVLIGREHNERKHEASASLWKIIAAASFIPTEDEQTIYLSWLAVSSMKAEFGKWNTKKTKKKQSHIDDVRLFFYGSTFSNGKGIRSIILAAVQYICSSLVPTQSPSRRYYEKIICQSSEQALEFYKVAMGFVEITDSTTIPTTVLNRFIKSQQGIPIKFTGWLHECRPTKVETRQDIHHISRQAHVQYVCSQT